MPFPNSVREESLVRSHRHCCVCHDFAGRDVNVHHIIQESDGGPNTLDNAIVLCLRCHSEAGHYNNRHPLGTKYSPVELRRHRDQWWGNCKKNPPFASKSLIEDLPYLRLNAQEPAQTLISFAKDRWNYPHCIVSVRMELSESIRSLPETPHQINQDMLVEIVRDGANLFIVGEAGAGKTTKILALCEIIIADSTSPLPIFIDAATWASTGETILDYIASFPAFANAKLCFEELSRLNEAGKLLIIFNGWNEIAINEQTAARKSLLQFLSGSASPRLIIATRSASDSLGIPNPKKVTVRGFTWEEQQSFIRQSLSEDSANALLSSLRSNPKLRAVTKNPLVLSGAISLHKSGQTVPDNLFDLLAAIVQAFEAEGPRFDSLNRAPLYGCHTAYLGAIAEAMNTSGIVVMQESEAKCIVAKVGGVLVEKGLFYPPPNPPDVLVILCGEHLLHRGEHAKLRFAHQRFQEFFSASIVLARLEAALACENERKNFQVEILNCPFWEDSTELAASKLKDNKNLTAIAQLLLELALPVDLAYASKLAGMLNLGNGSSEPWKKLRDAIEQMHHHTAPEARQYALQCAAATRSPEFAPLFWPLLESDNQQIRLTYYRLAEGLTLGQLGPGALERMAQWTDERRAESVWELTGIPENLEFIERLAQADPSTAVRSAAIRALYDFFLADDSAVKAWWNAPDAVKEADSTLSMALEIWNPDDLTLTSELVRIARQSSNAAVKRKVGIRLLGHAEEIGVDAAKHALLEQKYERDTYTAFVDLLKVADPDFLRNLAVERSSERGSIKSWMRQELALLPEDERDDLVQKELERSVEVEHYNINAAVAELASAPLVDRLLEEGLKLADSLLVYRKADESIRRRYRTIKDLLTCVPEAFFVQSVLSRAANCSYDDAAWIVEISDQRALAEEMASGNDAPWRPATKNLDALIQAFIGKRDSREISCCSLESHLISLASKTDPVQYLDYIIEGTRVHAHAHSAYDEALQRWQAQPKDSARPNSPPHVSQTLQRCGFDAVPRLLEIAYEPGASHILPEALVAIVSEPWEQRREKHTFPNESYIKGHQNRRSLGRVFLQPTETHQGLTDAVAQYIVRQIEAMLTPGTANYVDDVFKPSMRAHCFWETCKLLSRVPSPSALPTLQTILLREDAQIYPYIDIAQGLISQGGTLPSAALKIIKKLWQLEMVQKWHDNQAPYRFSRLAAFHFFVVPAETALSQLNELLAEWLIKAPLRDVITAIEDIPTPEALELLTELLPHCGSRTDYVDSIIHAICSNTSPETADKLLEFIETEACSTYSMRTNGLEKLIASRLKEAALNNAEFMQRLLTVFESRTAADLESLVAEVLGGMDDPKAIRHVCRYLDENDYPKGGHATASVLMNRFSLEKPTEPESYSYEVHPQSNISLRQHLYILASQPSASRNRARRLLLELEENRMELGRPSDETRHPAIETGSYWPTCLYLS